MRKYVIVLAITVHQSISNADSSLFGKCIRFGKLSPAFDCVNRKESSPAGLVLL
jgi:hypothetical protein